MGFPRKERKERLKTAILSGAIELMSSVDNSMENEYYFTFHSSSTDIILGCAAACSICLIKKEFNIENKQMVSNVKDVNEKENNDRRIGVEVI